jgi:hypothetical protein
MARIYRETEIQKALCRYVSLKYPKVLFNCDCSGLNLSKAQSGIASVIRSDKGFPDFVMYEPKGRYHGLFIEIKKEGELLHKKTGQKNNFTVEVYKNDHIKEQSDILHALQQKGYYALFGIGLDECMNIVDNYMLNL